MWLAVDGGKVGAADDCAFPDHEEQQRKSRDDELGSRLAKPPVRYLLLLCAVMYALLTSPLFPGKATLPGQGSAWTTPLSGHFLSTLALVPMLHVLARGSRGGHRLGAGAIVVSMVRGSIVRLRAGLVAAHRLGRRVGSDGGRDRLPAACIASSIGLSRRRPVGPLVRMGGARRVGVATARTHM